MLDWRAVFWVNVPVGVFGTLWAYLRLRETSTPRRRTTRPRIDWWGNITFAVGLSAVLVAVTLGLQPYHGQAMGWLNPQVLALLGGGVALLAVFVRVEHRHPEPMFELGLFRSRAFTAGNLAGLAVSVARGGLQFMMIMWLQGIWLPLHGYDYDDTPLWAGIYLLPLTAGVLVAGPVSGYLSDRFGARGLSTSGMAVFSASFVGLMLLPVSFSYWMFALLIAMNGIGAGMFAAPNSSAIMGAVPADQRGVASGMRATFQNSGTALSIGVFFSLMIAGLAATLPNALDDGLRAQGVSATVAQHASSLPPVSSLFATVLGVNPIEHLLADDGGLAAVPAAHRATVSGHEFFPRLLAGPFHHGLLIVFGVAAGLGLLAGLSSLLRGATPVTSVHRADPATSPDAGAAPRDDGEQGHDGAEPVARNQVAGDGADGVSPAESKADRSG